MKFLLCGAVLYYVLLAVATQWWLEGRAPTPRVQARSAPPLRPRADVPH